MWIVLTSTTQVLNECVLTRTTRTSAHTSERFYCDLAIYFNKIMQSRYKSVSNVLAELLITGCNPSSEFIRLQRNAVICIFNYSVIIYV